MVCVLACAAALPQAFSAQSHPKSALTPLDADDAAGAAGTLSSELDIQEPPLPVDRSAKPEDRQRVAVKGVVVNAATGEPLPRALVKMQEEARGALTDGEGRFEITGVPVGLQAFSVEKPGFRGKLALGDYVVPESHTVQVAAEMPELHFALAPQNVIAGQVSLSTGDAAVGIGLTLLRQTIQDGRAAWNEVERHQTTPAGTYRFAGLEDGTYVLMTQPAFDNERATAPSCSGPAPTEVLGYPVMFYGGSTDVTGAVRIVVARGQTSTANLALTVATFHEVQAAPGRALTGSWQVSSELVDRNGLWLEYPVRPEEKSHGVCAYLPDGAYTLKLEATINDGAERLGPGPARGRGKKQIGMVEFSVEGKPETHLRVPMGSEAATPIRVRYEPGPPKPGANGYIEFGAVVVPESGRMELTAVRVGGISTRGEGQTPAEWVGNDVYELGTVMPGAYWIQGTATGGGVCLGSVTADGQSLARKPWVAGNAGTGPAIDVVLRTDCAKLTLQAPGSFVDEPGEDPTYFAYLVPEFDSVAQVQGGMVQQSGDRSIDLVDMTPGAYRVYVFDTPQSLEPLNAEGMSRLDAHFQEVTLEPGGSATLVLEVPKP